MSLEILINHIYNISMSSYFVFKPEVSRKDSSPFARIDFRPVPVCKHASRPRDPVDVFQSPVQSENGGVCEWAWLNSVAVKMLMDYGFSLGQGTTLEPMLTKRLMGGYISDEEAVIVNRRGCERVAVGKQPHHQIFRKKLFIYIYRLLL